MNELQMAQVLYFYTIESKQVWKHSLNGIFLTTDDCSIWANTPEQAWLHFSFKTMFRCYMFLWCQLCVNNVCSMSNSIQSNKVNWPNTVQSQLSEESGTWPPLKKFWKKFEKNLKKKEEKKTGTKINTKLP